MRLSRAGPISSTTASAATKKRVADDAVVLEHGVRTRAAVWTTWLSPDHLSQWLEWSRISDVVQLLECGAWRTSGAS